MVNPNQDVVRIKNGSQKTNVVIKTRSITVKYDRMRSVIKDIVTKEKFVLFIIILAAFFRLYRMPDFAMFLGDQGRDAIVVKRIITLEHFPAIGPPSSLGQIFLGPFYYYLISPFLLLWNFNPIGLAYAVALVSILGIIISYFVIRAEANPKVSLLFLVFVAFSYVNIVSSRFSWNPNLLPVFSFLTLYFFYKFLASKKYIFAFGFGAFLALSLQLHHLAILLTIPLAVSFLYQLLKENDRTTLIKRGVLALVSFLFFSLPLIVFDLRHQFLNSKNLIKLFVEGNPTDHGGFLNRIFETNQALYSHILQTEINQYVAIFLTVFSFVYILKKYLSRKYAFVHIHLSNLIFFVIGFSLFNTARHPHYYNVVYFSVFLLWAFILINLFIARNFRIVLFVVVLFYLIFNYKIRDFIFSAGQNQFKVANNIAESIIKKNPKLPYQMIALPDVETDGHIRYFLEIKGKTPLPQESNKEAKELYVVCYEKECRIYGNPQWQIASFKNATIETSWRVEGITIYKLIHRVNR